MKERKQNRRFFIFFEPSIVISFWLLLFATPILLGSDNSSIDWKRVFTIWESFLPYLVLFLVNHYLLLPLLFFKNKRWLFISSAIVLIGLMAFGIYLRNESSSRPQSPEGPPHARQGPGAYRPPPDKNVHPGLQDQPKKLPPPRQLPPHFSFALISFLLIGFDTGLKLSLKWVRSEQDRINAEKQNMASQLAFLRNQVSPHFFMNTLNNIHSLIDLNSEEAKESIIRLSKLMRHLLYDSETEKIAITKEIEFVRNYVDLMKLRFSENVEIKLDILNPLPHKSIPPLLFTSFVENAFKHGISYQSKSFINISFSFLDENLIFKVDNSKHHSKNKEANQGIGIDNSRKRLDLIYGEKYTLKIDENNNEFNIHLSIPV